MRKKGTRSYEDRIQEKPLKAFTYQEIYPFEMRKSQEMENSPSSAFRFT